MPQTVFRYSHHDGEYQELESINAALLEALEAITQLGGNLSDERLEAVSGVNDARDRTIKYVGARQIARAAIAQATKEE